MEATEANNRKRKRILPRSQPAEKATTMHEELHKRPLLVHSHQYPRVPAELLQQRQALGVGLSGSVGLGITVTTIETVISNPETTQIVPIASTPDAGSATSFYASSQQTLPSSTPLIAMNDTTIPYTAPSTTSQPTINPGYIASSIVSLASKESSLLSSYPSNGTAMYQTSPTLSISTASVSATSMNFASLGSASSTSDTTSKTSTGSTLKTVSTSISGTHSVTIMSGPLSLASGFSSKTSTTTLTSDLGSSIFGSSTLETSTPIATPTPLLPSAGSATSASPTGTVGTGLGNSATNADGSLTPIGKSIVGGVVGGVAGVTVIILVVFIGLRWWRRKSDDSAEDALEDDNNSSPLPSSGPTSGGAALIPAAAMGMLKRFSRSRGPAPIEAPPPPIGQGGFERLGGRKLPSRFSPGMVGPGPGPTHHSPNSSNFTGPSRSYPSGTTYGSAALMSEDPFADPVSPIFTNLPSSAAATNGVGVALTTDRPSPAQSPSFGKSSEMQMRSQNQPLLAMGQGTPPLRGAAVSRFVEEDV